MATYTSVRSGKWDASDYDTWGGGIGVYPDVAGDIVNIAVGHTVTYNIQATHVLGKVSVYGTLKFSRSNTTEMVVPATVADQLQVYDGGTLDMGTVADPIPSTRRATLSIDATNIPKNDDYAGMRRPNQGIVINYGGGFTAVGSGNWYGGTYSALLDAEWTAGKTFTVTGDVSGWPVGARIALCNPYLNQNYNSAEFTVVSAVHSNGQTTITVNESIPTSVVRGRAGFPVVLLSRNVRIRTVGSLWWRYGVALDTSDLSKKCYGGGVTLWGNTTDPLAQYPDLQITAYRNIHYVEFDKVQLYAGDMKYVHRCSFSNTYNAIGGCTDGGSGWGDAPDPLIQDAKITDSVFYNINFGVTWHRECGGVDGSTLSGNIFCRTDACWHLVRDSVIGQNTYYDCEVAHMPDYKANVTRWWPTIEAEGPVTYDNIQHVNMAYHYGDYVTAHGNVDLCLVGYSRLSHSEINGDVSNTVIVSTGCADTVFNGSLAAVYRWLNTGQSATWGTVFQGYSLSRNTLWGHSASTVHPHVCWSNARCTYGGALDSEYAIIGDEVWTSGGTYQDANIFNQCTITCLTLFDWSFTNQTTKHPSLRAKFNQCVITQSALDDGVSPAWAHGVRHLPITCLPQSDQSSPMDTYIEFDGCTVTEHVTSEFPAKMMTIFAADPDETRHFDYNPFEVECYNGGLVKTKFLLSKAVKIANEGDNTIVEKFAGTLVDSDLDVNELAEYSVIATPKLSDYPALFPYEFRILELNEESVPAIERLMRAYAKLGAGWNTPPTAAQLRLEVTYPTAELGVATAYSTEVVGTDWTELSVLIVPGSVGTVTSRLVLYTTEGAATVIVDPAIYIGSEG